MFKKSVKIVSLVAAFSLIFSMAFMGIRIKAAAAYYVSTSGSDSNNGSINAPWRTLQYACDRLQAGDTLYVRGGTYNEKITINVSGTSTGYISICNYPNETPVISGTGIAGSDVVLISGRAYIKFAGFEVCNNLGDWITGININNGSHHIEIRNNKVHDINTNNAAAGGANGIISYGNNAAASNNNIIIDGNEIYNCVLGWSEALTINGNTEFWEVTNNRVHDVGNIGIDAAGHFGACPDASKDQARNGVIRGNTVYNCNSPNEGGAAAGLYVDGGKDIVIERNIVHDTQHGLEVGCENKGKTTSGIIARDNLVFGNTKAGIMVGGWSTTSAGKVTGSKILNNTCYKNDTLNTGTGELQISVVDGLTVKNNIFYSTSQNILLTNFFAARYVTNVTMDYNGWHCDAGTGAGKFTWLNKLNTGFSAYKTASGNDTNSKFINPAFINGTTPDLHLQSSSPAINAGDPAFVPASGETDYDGNIRLYGGCVDFGAYEHQSGGTVPSAPLISNIQTTNISQTGVTITWTTDAASSSIVEYGTTASYGMQSTGADNVTSHSATLSGLTAGTIYHYRVKSANAGGTAISTDNTFTTSASGGEVTITVDGNAAEWSSISPVATAAGQTATSLKVYNDATYIYFCIQGSNMGSNYEIFIDSDNSSATGYIDTLWTSTGLNYMIENGTLYSHPANDSKWAGWSSLGTANVLVSKNTSVCEVRVARTALSGLGSTVKAGFKDINSSWAFVCGLPSTGTLPSYTLR